MNRQETYDKMYKIAKDYGFLSDERTDEETIELMTYDRHCISFYDDAFSFTHTLNTGDCDDIYIEYDDIHTLVFKPLGEKDNCSYIDFQVTLGKRGKTLFQYTFEKEL